MGGLAVPNIKFGTERSTIFFTIKKIRRNWGFKKGGRSAKVP